MLVRGFGIVEAVSLVVPLGAVAAALFRHFPISPLLPNFPESHISVPRGGGSRLSMGSGWSGAWQGNECESPFELG